MVTLSCVRVRMFLSLDFERGRVSQGGKSKVASHKVSLPFSGWTDHRRTASHRRSGVMWGFPSHLVGPLHVCCL